MSRSSTVAGTMDKGREEHWGWELHSTFVEIVGPSSRISIPSTDNVGDQETEEPEEVGYGFFSFLFLPFSVSGQFRQA